MSPVLINARKWSWLLMFAEKPVAPPFSGKFALVRHVEERHPVARRVVLRGRLRVRRDHRGQVERLAGRRLHLRRIDEAVAAHPHVVVRLREVGDDVASAVVGDDDLREPRRQVVRFGDHPDARLGSLRAGDDAADVVVVDRHGTVALLGARPGQRRDPDQPDAERDGAHQRARTQLPLNFPVHLPLTSSQRVPYDVRVIIRPVRRLFNDLH